MCSLSSSWSPCRQWRTKKSVLLNYPSFDLTAFKFNTTLIINLILIQSSSEWIFNVCQIGRVARSGYNKSIKRAAPKMSPRGPHIAGVHVSGEHFPSNNYTYRDMAWARLFTVTLDGIGIISARMHDRLPTVTWRALSTHGHHGGNPQWIRTPLDDACQIHILLGLIFRPRL